MEKWKFKPKNNKRSNHFHYYFSSNFTEFGDFLLEPCWGRLLNLKGHRVRSGKRRHPKLTTTKFTGTSAVCVSHIAAPSEPLVAPTEPGNGSRSRPALAALGGCGKYIFLKRVREAIENSDLNVNIYRLLWLRQLYRHNKFTINSPNFKLN